MSSNGIYVWDSNHGIPTSFDEATEMLDKLSNTTVREPSANMAAFGKLMGRFVKKALEYFDGNYELEQCANIARTTAKMRQAVYSFEGSFEGVAGAFDAYLILSASNTGCVVYHGDWEEVYLPDGTCFNAINQAGTWHDKVAQGEANWKQFIKEQKDTSKPKIPKGEKARRNFLNKMVQEYSAGRIEAYFAKYNYSLLGFNEISWFKDLETEFIESFKLYTIIADSYGEPFFQCHLAFTFRNNEDVHEINQFIREDLGMKFKMPYVGMINFCKFYGLARETEPRCNRDVTELTISDDTDYDEVVSWIKASVDMLLYYLPHISTKEDFMRFMKAHYAGETNFSELTLPTTDPSKRQFEDRDKREA